MNGFPSRARLPVARRRIPLGLESCEPRIVCAGESLLPAFDMGNPTVADVWVDPAGGTDTASGTSRAEALRTLTEAWRRVPARTPLVQGVRINLTAGVYPEAAVPNYWESRHGSRAAPVIVRAADGPGTARLPAVNVYDCRFLYFDGLEITAGGGDVLHLEACTNVLVRNTTIRGTGDITNYASPQEAFKANQCQYVYVEHCDISGGWDNAIDFVAVQHGHVVGSRIHRAGDWAMYAKGGSAYLTITGNEFFDAGTGGFTAGQGTGFEFMVAPWLHYEAYGITFTNNVIHDTQGAGIGVNGGYDVVLAHNTLYRVGARSHVIEVGFGSRSCDGDAAACRTRLTLGGWGTAVVGAEEPIPNRNVFIVNNLVLNPDGFVSRWQQFAVAGPRTPGSGSNIPTPARADDTLVIRGNVIWNGPADHPLGIEDGSLAAAVTAANAINTVRPVLVDPARGNYALAAGTALPTAGVIPGFTWADAPPRPAVPAGSTDTAVAFDHRGAARSGPQVAGAFALLGADPPPVVAPPLADTVRPVVVSVALPTTRLYRRGEWLTFTVRFSEPVHVTGGPRLLVRVGAAIRFATLAGGSGTATLLFRYRVVAGDVALRGIAVTPLVGLPLGAAIRDAAGNPAVVALPPLATAGIRLDGRSLPRVIR
jgi:hypothetical protein